MALLQFSHSRPALSCLVIMIWGQGFAVLL